MSLFSIIRPRRRWLRFSLRGMFVTLLAASVALGLWSRSAMKQKKAVETLRTAGWVVVYELDVDPQLLGKSANALDEFLGIDFLNCVKGVGEPIGGRLKREEIVPLLRDLPRLRTIELMQSLPTNGDLHAFGEMRNLESLKIWHCSSITDEGIESLKELTDLQIALFGHASFTVQGLKYLGTLPKLYQLSIDRRILESDWPELAKFKQLTELRVLVEGGAGDQSLLEHQLSESLPRCNLQFDSMIDLEIFHEMLRAEISSPAK